MRKSPRLVSASVLFPLNGVAGSAVVLSLTSVSAEVPTVNDEPQPGRKSPEPAPTGPSPPAVDQQVI